MKQKMFSAISAILILAAVALPASSFAADDDRKH
jgi:hypothetical protein